MSDDLVAFLNARLDEDEAAAKAANVKQDDPEWRCSPVQADLPGTVTVRSRRDSRPMARIRSVGGESEADITDGTAVAAHIARHDPARVLHEVAAKRAIVGLHRIEVAKVEMTPFDPFTGERRLDQYEVTCEICGWSSDDPTSACATLRALAAVYSDHPDYREEWKP